ncbi:MAG: hypothetical protein LBF74_10640 [Treponema sp.]|jgi:hypothetical protein|nr:hypothetical protein [Treponema sp.]
MKKPGVLILCILASFYIASCATTQITEAPAKEAPAELDDSAEFAQEDEEVRILVETIKGPSHGRAGRAVPAAAAVRAVPRTEPDSDAYHTDYHEFGPDGVPFVVSVPNNTDQEINAIVWFCDDAITDSSVFDLGTYPAEYKEKYIIAVMPYKFKSGDVRVKNIRNSIGDVVDFVKLIAEDHQIDLNRIILVGYTTGRFSMAYL